MPLPLILTSQHRLQIEDEGVAAYPNECCGIIYGVESDGRRIVTQLEPVPNVFDEAEKYHRFSISPKQLMDADKKAGSRGELLLGFYHSHPDHPARPSEYDRVHGWPFYSYIIVAIHQRKPVDLTSWQLNESTEQFDAQQVLVE